MNSTDEVLRAQARALIRVLTRYGLQREGDGDGMRMWRAVEAYGNSAPKSRELLEIYVEFGDAAHEATFRGMPVRASKACLLLALHTFCVTAPVHRFRNPSRWIAAALEFVDPRAAPVPSLQGEIFEKLEDTFDEEMTAKEPA